jgi:hypothetical protein
MKKSSPYLENTYFIYFKVGLGLGFRVSKRLKILKLGLRFGAFGGHCHGGPAP